MERSVLITGAAGFVGQHLVNRLTDEGHHVVALDIKPDPPASYSDHVGGDVEYVSGSVTDEGVIDEQIRPRAHEFGTVFHLAAIVGVSNYADAQQPFELLDVSVGGTRNVLGALEDADPHFVYVSTSEVYGKNPNFPWTETDDQVLGPPTVSRWSYSTMKSVCEHLIHMLSDADPDFRSTVVRPFNLYGPHQRPDFVIPKFMDQVLNGGVPTVYGDGTQKRCFTYIEDFIDGLVRAANRGPDTPSTYNLGSTTEIEIRELGRLILEVAEVDRELEYVTPESVYDDEYDEPFRRVPDVARAKEHLDWRPSKPLRTGLERTYEAMRESTGDR